MADSCTIHGLKELEQALLTFSDKLAGATLKSALMSGAKVIADEAKDKAPVSEKPHHLGSAYYVKVSSGLIGKYRNKTRKDDSDMVQPGFMRAQIGRRTAKESQHSCTVKVGVFRRRKDPGYAFYWIMKEFGTRKQGAHPFLRPAFEMKKTEAAERVKEALSRRVAKEAAKR